MHAAAPGPPLSPQGVQPSELCLALAPWADPDRSGSLHGHRLRALNTGGSGNSSTNNSLHGREELSAHVRMRRGTSLRTPRSKDVSSIRLLDNVVGATGDSSLDRAIAQTTHTLQDILNHCTVCILACRLLCFPRQASMGYLL